MDMRTPIKEVALKLMDGRLKWRDIAPFSKEDN